MGQQQLLLVVLGMIIVGVAVAGGIKYFRANAIDQKRDLLVNECLSLASQASAYYKKAANFGGGSNKFTGWQIPAQQLHTGTGSFTAIVFEDSVIITGTGNEVVNGTDSVKIKTTVYPDSYLTQIIN